MEERRSPLLASPPPHQATHRWRSGATPCSPRRRPRVGGGMTRASRGGGGCRCRSPAPTPVAVFAVWPGLAMEEDEAGAGKQRGAPARRPAPLPEELGRAGAIGGGGERADGDFESPVRGRPPTCSRPPPRAIPPPERRAERAGRGARRPTAQGGLRRRPAAAPLPPCPRRRPSPLLTAPLEMEIVGQPWAKLTRWGGGKL
jgi:hypothetical protein